ncbi:MAG TPA: hypothetical protein VGW36_09100 [Pyrinomonadaceae bacterium]|nr:hypothetical protein [Pyrinomonadaceae bacterium]
MSELEEAWALALAEAEARARAAGRVDISEYLALRGSNDLLRKTGIGWLLGLFESIAQEANTGGTAIQINREDGHRFKVGTATMVGPLLKLQRGVRNLKVEVGWPRTPRDGFIRGGGLACGNITHVGIKSSSEQIKLVLAPNGEPRWVIENKPKQVIHEADVREHVSILVDNSKIKRS